MKQKSHMAVVSVGFTSRLFIGAFWILQVGDKECSCGGEMKRGICVKPKRGDAILFWSVVGVTCPLSAESSSFQSWKILKGVIECCQTSVRIQNFAMSCQKQSSCSFFCESKAVCGWGPCSGTKNVGFNLKVWWLGGGMCRSWMDQKTL